MSNTCAEQHKFHISHQIEVPPRKLFVSHNQILENNLPAVTMETSNLQKYLPSNRIPDVNIEDDDDADPYTTDHFRIYEFKVRRCTRSRSHDWTDCPFAHPGEKARRRDPRRFRYSSTVCSDFRRGGGCPRGDDCEFAHGVFECWLHPTRYRTEACKDGKYCNRKVCFFAHTSRELRLLPEPSPKYQTSCSNSSSPMNKNHRCCLFCNSVTSSPTSTLLGLSHLSRSPSLSPPLSPVKQRACGISPMSRYGGERLSKFGTEMMSYKEALSELISSLENMNYCEVSSPMAGGNNLTSNNIPLLDMAFNGEDQQQFLLSPPRPSPSRSAEYFVATPQANEKGFASGPDPDLGWVNDLLM